MNYTLSASCVTPNLDGTSQSYGDLGQHAPYCMRGLELIRFMNNADGVVPNYSSRA